MATTVSAPPVGGWVPSRKVISAFVIGLLTIAGHAVASGGWDTTEWGELFTLGSGVVAAYFVTNAPGDATDPSTIPPDQGNALPGQ
jgi:hypothetical protein